MSVIPAESLPPAPPRRKGRPVLAWLVILGLVGFLLWRNRQAAQQHRYFDPVMVEMQSRYQVSLGEGPMVYKQAAQALDRGPFGQRLRFAVLAGDLAGPAEARECLRDLQADPDLSPTPEQQKVAEILDRLYAAREKDVNKPAAIAPAEQEELRQRLGWFGDLALTPKGSDEAERARVLAPAQRTKWVLLGFFGFLLLVGFTGFILGVLLLVLWLLGRLRGGIRVGLPYGGVYAETFAVYMLVYFGMSYAVGHLPVPGDLHALASGGVALAALAALAWPVLRGVPWRQVRADIGWTAGRRPGLEPVLGVGCYMASLPFLLVGLLVYFALSAVLKSLGVPVEAPGHPVVGEVVRGTWGVRVQWILDVCVVAPLVEETMFRGVLYRHLREASGRAGPTGSVIFSAAVASTVFAIIHPQGILYAPAVAGLATGFSLAREWRGTLVPPMIAHGINNGVQMTLFLLAAT